MTANVSRGPIPTPSSASRATPATDGSGAPIADLPSATTLTCIPTRDPLNRCGASTRPGRPCRALGAGHGTTPSPRLPQPIELRALVSTRATLGAHEPATADLDHGLGIPILGPHLSPTGSGRRRRGLAIGRGHRGCRAAAFGGAVLRDPAGSPVWDRAVGRRSVHLRAPRLNPSDPGRREVDESGSQVHRHRSRSRAVARAVDGDDFDRVQRRRARRTGSPACTRRRSAGRTGRSARPRRRSGPTGSRCRSRRPTSARSRRRRTLGAQAGGRRRRRGVAGRRLEERDRPVVDPGERLAVPGDVDERLGDGAAGLERPL